MTALGWRELFALADCRSDAVGECDKCHADNMDLYELDYRDPAGWLPPNQDFHCEYVRAWVIEKGYWGLAMDDRERSAVFSILGQCESSTRGLSH